MSGLDRRSLSWFEGWILESTDPTNPQANRKQEVARELMEAIKSGDYNAQTLQRLIQVLDHECLCFESAQDDTVPQGLPSVALNSTWTSKAFQQLLECRINSISTTSHFERELLSRSILSALALLRAQKVGYFRSEDFTKLHQQFRNQHQDLEWQRIRSGPFTIAKFRQFQAACLLCSSAEHAKFIRRAEPLLVTAISRLAHILFAGAPLAALAATVGVIVLSTSTDLRRRLLCNRALEPLRGKKS
jgi:hypothetical protein